VWKRKETELHPLPCELVPASTKRFRGAVEVNAWNLTFRRHLYILASYLGFIMKAWMTFMFWEHPFIT
jgi:hypothetical protein